MTVSSGTAVLAALGLAARATGKLRVRDVAETKSKLVATFRR